MIKTNLDNDSLPPQRTEFALPSGGVPYLVNHASFPNTVVIEPYSFVTEEILRSGISSHEKVVSIAEAVVKNFPKDFDFKTLLHGDHMVIMAIARALTYGERYDFSVQCPACDHVEGHSIKVPDELPVKKWSSVKTVEDLLKWSTVELPHCKDRIVVSWPTIWDGQKDEKQAEKSEKKGKTSVVVKKIDKWLGKELVLSMASRVVSVNNTKPDDLGEAAEYVSRLAGRDMVAFEDFFKERSCGIDQEWTIVCDKCGNPYNRMVPISADFFRRNRTGRLHTKPVDSE